MSEHVKWKEGDEVVYMDGGKMKVFAGLFWYSGFGCGHLYQPDHEIVWCAGGMTEAYERLQPFGLEPMFRDSFTGYRPTYLGD